MDSYGQDLSSMTIGGVYGFIEPSVDVAKKQENGKLLKLPL